MSTLSIFDNSQDLEALRAAVARLEAPSLTIRLANFIGSPIEMALDSLPKSASEKIQQAVHAALNKAVATALWSMDKEQGRKASTKTHSAVAAASGALGGFFGLAGTLIELPVSTTIMMRSVADIARSEGFVLTDPAIQAECIQVFAMGGASKHDDAADSAYYALRTALTEIAKETGRALAASAVSQSAGGLNLTPGQAAAWLASIIEAVAKRFGIKITEKVAAQAAPVIGAVSGAAINTLFINHYQDMARGHFTVKRLELKYGEDAVRAAYEHVRNRH